MEQAYQAAARMLHGTSADIGVGELDRIVRGAVSAFLACQPPARREVRMWLVEHEWKPRADTLRAGGATSYHDAKYTTEAQVDAELTRLRALPNVARAMKTPLYAEPQPTACPVPAEGDETYYSQGKDGPWFEALPDKDFAWELVKAAQDLNDSGLGNDLDKWMPFQVMLADAAARIERRLAEGSDIEQALLQLDEHFPGAFWLLGKGKASAAEKLYGFQMLFGTDEVLSDGEADDPVSAILAAIENGKSRQSRPTAE